MSTLTALPCYYRDLLNSNERQRWRLSSWKFSVWNTRRKRLIIGIIQLNICHLPGSTNTYCYSAVKHILGEFPDDQRASCGVLIHFLHFRLKYVDLKMRYELEHINFCSLIFRTLYLDFVRSAVSDTVLKCRTIQQPLICILRLTRSRSVDFEGMSMNANVFLSLTTIYPSLVKYVIIIIFKKIGSSVNFVKDWIFRVLR